MSGNGRGRYRSSRANVMRAYDTLPPEVRQALANADHPYAPQVFVTRLRRGRTLGHLIWLIGHWDTVNRERAGKRMARS
jgi:hypothetical protein